MSTKNIKITRGELTNCGYDETCNYIPDMYILWFTLHNETFMAGFCPRDLKDAKNGETLYCCYSETTDDITATFESELQDIKNEVVSYCEHIWKHYINRNDIYNYLGEEI